VKPIEFKGQEVVLGAPKDWDHETDGKCTGLPIKRDNGQCISLWTPTRSEIEALQQGAAVQVAVFSGNTQPPISINVQKIDGSGLCVDDTNH
jgi:hypothetical protein